VTTEIRGKGSQGLKFRRYWNKFQMPVVYGIFLFATYFWMVFFFYPSKSFKLVIKRLKKVIFDIKQNVAPESSDP
jgi:hypothetical protein